MTEHEDARAARRAAWAKMSPEERKAEWARFRAANPVNADEVRRAFDPPKRVHKELYRQAAMTYRDRERARLYYLKEVAAFRMHAFEAMFEASHPGIDPGALMMRKMLDPRWSVVFDDFSKAHEQLTTQTK